VEPICDKTLPMSRGTIKFNRNERPMSQRTIVEGTSWFKSIAKTQEHILIHATSICRGLKILRTRTIHGNGSGEAHLEGYAHFSIKGWPEDLNALPVPKEVVLKFQSSLPALYREVNELPKKGYLSVYSASACPWQCCIHPENGPLEFIGANLLRPNDELRTEVDKAKSERRMISLTF